MDRVASPPEGRVAPALHGWLTIDKPVGMTSTRAVAIVKRLTGAAKVGHGGTLDPLATGVLPMALGEATKTVAYVMDGAKSYEFRVKWGAATNTDDAEGEITLESSVRPGRADIEAVLGEFEGEIEQTPPAFSAIKIGGRRAYALARAGAPPELAPRRVQIHRLALLENATETAEFLVECGKGTYVRALARDLARRLGTAGHVVSLRRTRAGPFSLDSAISLESEALLSHSARLADVLLPVETALADIPALVLSGNDAVRLRHGQAIPLRGQCVPASHSPEGSVCVMADGRPVALARVAGGVIRPLRVFNWT
jgi:tRNA pseudouridine55 synthase